MIGCAFNPNVKRMEPEIKRLERKVSRGARFAMTQPVFDVGLIEEMYEKTAHIGIPILLGVMPLTTYRNASFLHNEVPGIRISQNIMDRMKEASEEDASDEGMEIARELLDAATSIAPGFYIIPQLEKYEVAAKLVQHLKKIENSLVGEGR